MPLFTTTSLLLLFLISLTPTSSSSSSSISPDATSLLAIKSSVSSDPSNRLATWNSTATHHCHWHGVTCDAASGRVISLNITGSATSQLSGTLPPELGNLTELRTLSIPYNAFTGEIPAEITSLVSLDTIELQGNQFSGSIPERLIGFGAIRKIDLSYNRLNGGIRIDPSSRCDSLRYLKLSGNFLTDSIPPEIGNCTNLESILINENILENRIPAEIGRISALEVLDVSRNSLTGRIPEELAKCRKFSVIVLTNLVDGQSAGSRGEFNAFDRGIPDKILLLPELEIFWAPRANLGGRMPRHWSRSCKLRVLNLGQNYMTGVIPERIGLCRNLSYLDLSSNVLMGPIPSRLQLPCMFYFNVSRNTLTGNLPQFTVSNNCSSSMISYVQDNNLIEKLGLDPWISPLEVVHDFSWNNFIGELPLFSFGFGFLSVDQKPLYKLLLNNNRFNGSLPTMLFSGCDDLQSFAVNVSANHISGVFPQGLLLNCSKLIHFEAANNQLSGSVSPGIADSQMLQYIDLRENRITGSIPVEVARMKELRWILLGRNNLTGEFPTQLGQLASLRVLDLSGNALTGTIPASLASATKLEVLLLDHNRLIGQIPSSFLALRNLTRLDVSFNKLTGMIPPLQHLVGCDGFKGNKFLEPCPNTKSSTTTAPFEVPKLHGPRSKTKLILIALGASASLLLFILVTVLVVVSGRKKLGRLANFKRKVVVTFVGVPTELNYDNVVRATGNFSVQFLIGTGGFGATYKAEVVPGFLVAVKRLAIGRFQGVQQFDAEIRTLGRIRHKNLVTLIGYHMGDAEMFLIYNYLSGGNLETFIHESSGNNVRWLVIHKIALDIAQALAYLHESCVPRIVHRDIKPSNILLDEDFNAYLSDFGLARLLEVSETHATTDVAGTFGYVAPEYAMTCRVSDKADVYSYGVVLLELISGKRSLDPSFSDYGNGFNIVTWAMLLIKEGRSSDFFSRGLWEVGPQEKLLAMLRLASACTVESLSIRPSMKQVAEKLKQLKIPDS